MIPKLGTLVEVNLREAWSHEAHSFTPWLAEHLDRLSDVIGIPLEFEKREVSVDTFSADILARNPLDDSLVLIENQLEGTDHTHLGQIMTYLAGLEAHTIVWIAADFWEAHLSALNWLNEHTVEPFAFFGVKVKAVRIGDSSIAPIFEVLSRPNHWDRQLHTIAQGSRQMSNLGQFRKDFWLYYLSRFPHETQHGAAGGTSSRWRSLRDLDLVISIYIAQKEVGVYVRGLRDVANPEIYELLMPQSEQLSLATGAKFGNPDGKHFFVSRCLGKTTERGDWDRLTDWLHSTSDVYEATLRRLLGGKMNDDE
jgi:hypothetical protein